MTTMDERIAHKNKLIPQTGYNVVAIDPFGVEVQDELYLVGHHDSIEAANKQRAEMEAKHPGIRYFVYAPDTR